MRRKKTKNTRGPNQQEKDFQGWLKDRRICCITGQNNVEVHHCKGATFKHNKVLIGHWFVIPLCEEVHKEYDQGTKAFLEKYGPQSGLWMECIKEYVYETGRDYPPEDVTSAIIDYGR